jgi:hypothetical protein
LSTSGLSLSLHTDRGGLKFKLFLHSFSSQWLTMTSLFANALAEEGGFNASTADELYSVQKSTARAWQQIYQRDGQVGRRRGIGL